MLEFVKRWGPVVLTLAAFWGMLVLVALVERWLGMPSPPVAP